MYTVLAISCHPDDMEIACAGTLLKCKERGDRVVICHLSSGNLGHVVIPPDELRVMRAKEAEKSAAMGGFEYEALANGNVKVDFVWGNGTVLELRQDSATQFTVVSSTNANYIPAGTIYTCE